MFKYALLVSAMVISAPVLAQNASPGRTPMTASPAPQDAVPPTTMDAPAPSTMPLDQSVQTPAAPTTAPLDQSVQTPATPVTPAAPADQAAQAPAGTATPATSEAQVAGVVKAEFPTYDKDANGGLNNTEFASWMGALRKASEPTLDTASAETKTWIEGAFVQADADKSKSVTQVELTTFLTAGQPS